MSAYEKFKEECEVEVEAQGQDESVLATTHQWNLLVRQHKYCYHFEWLGRPIIQYPPDIVSMQELIWKVKPDLIIETGVAHGGSLIAHASMLALLDYSDAVVSGELLDPANPRRKVVGIDIDIRAHNRHAIESHPMATRINLIEGSSTSSEVIEEVTRIASGYNTVLVCLDSNHTHDHVLAELRAYASLVTKGSYCIVFDTIIDDMPDSMYPNRPWGPGNNPKTAVKEYLQEDDCFEIDKKIQKKLLITVAPDGYLKKIK